MMAMLLETENQPTATIIAVASTIAFIVSTAFNVYQYYQMKKTEDLKYLLGEKETVAYAALKLLRKGLPEVSQKRRWMFPWDIWGYLKNRRLEERQLMSDAILQACIMEGSDRARAILYHVIEKNSKDKDIRESLETIENIYEIKHRYKFDEKQLDLKEKVWKRIEAMKMIIDPNYDAGETIDKESENDPSIV